MSGQKELQDGRRNDGLPAEFTVTSTTLLHGLRDPANQEVWHQYVDRYRPLIVGYVQRVGLTAEDAEDVAQSSLLDFSSDFRAGRYDRHRGRLRHWLFGIVHNRIKSARRRSELPLPGDADLMVTDCEMEETWEAEWRATLLEGALRQVRHELEPSTYEAFELFAIEGLAADEVGQRLGLSANAVHGAKRRILRRVAELIPLLEDTF